MSNKRGHHRRSGQNYERTDRVSGLVKEIVAGELERIDDSRLFLVSITGVDVDRELANATVWFHISDEEDLEVVADALEQHRQMLANWIKETGDQGQKTESNAGLLATLKRWGNKCVNPEYDRVRAKFKK